MGGWGLGGLIEGWRAGCVSVEDFGDVGFGMGEMNGLYTMAGMGAGGILAVVWLVRSFGIV